MNGNRRIFYDKLTGDRIQEIGRNGDFTLPTIEQDIATYTALSERNRETFAVLELPFGAYQQDFAESVGYRVNVETKELEFQYRDENEPGVEQPYQKPLSEEVARLTQENEQLKAQDEELNMAVIDIYEIVLGGM